MEKSIKRLFIQLRENKSLKFTLDEEEPLSKVKPIFNKNLPFYYFGNFEEKYYTEDDLTNYFNQINERFDVKLTVKNGFLEFERSFGGNPYHVLIHPSMMETFGFESDILLEHLEHMYTLSSFDPSEMLPNKKIWKKNVIDHMMNYNGQLYYKFYVGNVSDVLKATKSPTSKTKDNFPQVVKVVSNNISPQIFNSSYSNDMVVFCPNFKNNDVYYFHEFESRQYVPLLNSSLTDFEIKLCDEENRQLQLLPGVASFLKLHIRKMSEKRNFNVRLTSASSKAFPNNKSNNFKIKLPNILSLDKRWRVALTSISHPNTFNTFLPEKNTRGIIVKEILSNKQGLKLFSDTVHTPETITNELIEFFQKHNFGEVKIDSESKLKIKFSRECLVGISNNLLRVLGYNEPLSLTEPVTTMHINTRNTDLIFGTNEDGTDNFTLLFNTPINVNALRPNYIIAYTNFIESSIIGGIYSKILRVIPVSSKEKGFIISDFKHKEFLELQNTEISEIEIVLRSHDGAYVYFGTKEDVILNLEFTTDDEIMM